MTAKADTDPLREALEPCPFCGSPAAMSVLLDDDNEPEGDIISAWVDCPCGVEMHESRTEAEAAMRWNARAALASEPVAGMVDIEIAHRAAMFREGTKRLYEEGKNKGDMWFFELWHFLGDVASLSPQTRGATSSPAPLSAPHNSGEGDPSVMPDYGAGETTPPLPGADIAEPISCPNCTAENCAYIKGGYGRCPTPPAPGAADRAAVIEEWRAARQDIFDNTSKISDENTERWTRLSNAEHALMSMASTLPRAQRGTGS